MGFEIMTNEKPFHTHPSKKVLILFTTLWLIGTSLLVLVITDLFTEPLFRSGQSWSYGMIATSTLVVFKLYLNYFKNTVSSR
jgi:hypothetical protein